MTKGTPTRKKGTAASEQGTNPEEIESLLEGCDFPCGAERLVAYLEQQEAPEYIVRQVQGIPDREYHGPNEVVDAVESQTTTWVVGGRRDR